MKRLLLAGLSVLVLVLLTTAAQACSLCGPLANKQTLRMEMKNAPLVVYGKLANATLNLGPGSVPGSGSTDLNIVKVLKPHPALAGKQVVTIKNYIPILDPKNPPLFVVFVDVKDGQLNAYLGRSAESPALLGYLEGVKNLGEAVALHRLAFFYQYLDHADTDIATDAFLEFARTPDKDLADAAQKLDAEKFRKLLLDPKTGSEKIGLFAFLLAAGKNPKDADLLRGMVEKPTAKTQGALDGLLCGYIQLQPDDGWKMVYSILGNKKKSFNDRYAAFRVVRFYYNWRPKDYQPQIMYGLNVMLGSDLADLAIDSLRRWEVWDLTPAILNLYGKEGYSAPIVKRAIVRYALCCPLPQAKGFVDQVRKIEPDLVQEIEQDLLFEKKLSQANP